ncbi:MAG: mechanosensitive ion channel [Phycisphaera sp.]|nr:mechanosensitive ion channel [Phycisphaera sp.]
MAMLGYEAWYIQPGVSQPEEGQQTDTEGQSTDAQSEEPTEGLPAVANQTREAANEAANAGEEAFSALMSGDTEAAGAAAKKLVAGAVPLLTNIAIGIVIILVALFLAGRVRSIVTKTSRKARVDETLGSFFGQLAKWAIIGIGLVSAIGYMGVPTASFAAVIGGASLAIGLAFQGSLGNLAAGVMLLIFRPFKIGDVVQVGGITAKVTEIDLFTTMLDTPDNRRIIMPNGNIFGNEIENITFHPTRRVDITVGTEYPADLDKAREVLMGAIKKVDGALTDPAPVVYLNELGDSSINWAVRVWANTPDYWAIKEKLTRQIKYDLDAADIGIPFPQMDVHIDGKVLNG